VEAVLFGVTAVCALAGGVGVIVSVRPVHSVLSLLVVLLSLSVDYLLLGAQFVAVLQVIIYAGAILVLFLFVIMLLAARRGEGPGAGAPLPAPLALALCAALALVLLTAVWGAGRPAVAVPADFGSIQQVGRVLFRRYLLPFEAASIVLLIGMIGAVVLGKRLPPPAAAGTPGDRR
jgi:NADH-quinone oxidoreductase subunit J